MIARAGKRLPACCASIYSTSSLGTDSVRFIGGSFIQGKSVLHWKVSAIVSVLLKTKVVQQKLVIPPI